MNRTLRPSVESLEGKNLMTATAGLAYSLTAVPIQSGGHEEIQLNLTITNTSRTTEIVNNSPSLAAFVAKQNGQVVWQSNAGYSALYISTVRLAPGQSTHITQVWDETSNVGAKKGSAITGAVVFDNVLAPNSTASDNNVGAPVVRPPVLIGTNPFTTLVLAKKK